MEDGEWRIALSATGKTEGRMQVYTIQQSPTKHLPVKDFARPIPQQVLNLEEKSRANLFAWRGQFSPQLVETLLNAYCPAHSCVADPFVGSGTVLYEAARLELSAVGYEINPSAWSFSKLYEFANLTLEMRNNAIRGLRARLEEEFPLILLSDDHRKQIPPAEIEERIIRISTSIGRWEKILCNALVVLLDIYNKNITNDFVQSQFSSLVKLVRTLPYSPFDIHADLQDARRMPLENASIDFVITSPPYINVFNYHQNYRRSVEILGWDVLRVARSEIGSNRANRSNRFLTAVQYCIDMVMVLQEMARVLKPNGRAVLIVGHESRVLGTPLYNADIVERIISNSKWFDVVIKQERIFKNRFGQDIRENILNIASITQHSSVKDIDPLDLGRAIAREILGEALQVASGANMRLVTQAVERSDVVVGTPLFESDSYTQYQTRDNVMVVKEEVNRPMPMPVFPTPHLAKLNALLNNKRLPKPDKPRLHEALVRYQTWITELSAVEPNKEDSVQRLVDATNRYKRFIEIDLIFDSPHDFLYRQKGQLKLDNTILEEFLPHLFYRTLHLSEAFDIGPQSTFAGLSFGSTIAHLGSGGKATIRTKDQDFVLGKRLYAMTSFDPDFSEVERLEMKLGFVCAECKTNLDKTMFQEAVATSRDLKIALPSSLYFLVCEFLDMTPVSITSTNIDDIFIVRKSRRLSATTRQAYKTAEERKNNRDSYIDFVDNAIYHTDVFQRMIDKVRKMTEDKAPEVSDVLERGYF